MTRPTDCAAYRERLAALDDVGAAIRDEATWEDDLRAHVGDCVECQAIAAALARLDGALAELPPTAEPAAATSERVLAAVAAARRAESTDGAEWTDEAEQESVLSLPRWQRPSARKLVRIAAPIAAVLVLGIAVALLGRAGYVLPTLRMEPVAVRPGSQAPSTSEAQIVSETEAPSSTPRPNEGKGERGKVSQVGKVAADRPVSPPPGVVGGVAGDYQSGDYGEPTVDDTGSLSLEVTAAPLDESTNSSVAQTITTVTLEVSGASERDSLRQQQADVQNAAANMYRVARELTEGEDRVGDKANQLAAKRKRDANERNASLADAREDSKEELVQPGRSSGLASRSGLANEAQQLLEEQFQTDALTYQEATGYWANTYVPGDPTLRLLEARLRKEPVEFLRPDGTPYHLEALARQNRQPFDAPDDAALAVYVHADRKYVAGQTRMLLQVGLQGTQRKSGLRPAMNIGVVLDLTSTPSREHGAAMRALLQALAAQKQTGDRFSLTVAGCPGAELVTPEEFRHGPLTVALARLFAGEVEGTAPTLELEEAVGRAMASVAQGDDPSSSLGASAVFLVTAETLDIDTHEAIERLAHTSAVGGIPLSVIGVGPDVDEDQIDTLVLAGQGNRRLIASADEAPQLIDRELHSVSRVVARAVRLRIRLGNKVRLVEMLGSKRLDDAGSDRVREAERSVDLRLARNLGIEADRGDDEEGMQIVIPSYYAGDSHVFLLDVVMDGPGQLADVTVRYKDLVFLRNGVARANRTLGSLQANAGPLEHNVLKNWLAVRLADAIQEAGEAVADGELEAALTTLAAQQRLLDQMRGQVHGWWNDAELHNDIAMLGNYQAVLRTADSDDYDRIDALADSLQFAGRRKVVATLR